MVGKTMSHYKVLENLVMDGMGEVDRAEGTHLSREREAFTYRVDRIKQTSG